MGKVAVEKSSFLRLRYFKASESDTGKISPVSASSRLKKILYLACYAAPLLAWIGLPKLSAAQEDRPQITPQDKVVNKKKKGGEPRAVGLVQLKSNGKATLVPIAILINGKFWDASSYKATPVPMALESGTVYEGEHTGSSVGLFTVNGALHSTNPGAVDPWIGTGQWLPQGKDVPKTGHKAETVPLGMETKDDPPRLTKSGKPQKDAATGSTPTGADTKNTPEGTEPADTTAPESDKKSQEASKADQNAPKEKADSSKTNDSGSSKSKNKSDEAAPAPGEDTNSEAGDSGRPKLRRGKPTEPLPADEDIPGYAKPGSALPGSSKSTDIIPGATASEKNNKGGAKNVDQGSVKIPAQLIPAISDASGPDPRSFVFEWTKGEEDDRRKQMLALAQEQLHSYVLDRAKGVISAKPASAKGPHAAHKAAAKTPDLVLEDLQIRTFDLWANNQPVIVLTAKAHPPLPAVGKTPEATPVPEYTIALVARTDIYNNLHKLYTAVTDKYHLDVTPQLELIDAVDADGDGRGELLFRETSDSGSGYVIYRATADKLWKMFDGLSPM
ncbi:MAG TPA: hypothetical protein VI386_08525 [Candidatus Sulfotelmatobacter sp.]